MDDYVPTVDEVRYWVAGRDLYAGAEFDRMIATVRADHEKAVRERIAREAEKAWRDGSWALARGTADWIRAREGA